MSEPGVRPSDAYRLLGEEVKFRGKLVAVTVEHFILPSGLEARHERIHLPAAVAVLPLLVEAGRPPEVVLVEQFRGSVRGFIHEVPAGVVEEGINDELSDSLKKKFDRLKRDRSLIPGLSLGGVVWLNPGVFCDVQHAGSDSRGHFKEPNLKKVTD